MQPIKFTLCEECEHCPEVEITDESIRTGENENIVRLSHREWNQLSGWSKAALLARSDHRARLTQLGLHAFAQDYEELFQVACGS